MADINLGVGGANSAVGGYDIANSLKLEADNAEYLSRNPSTDTNRQTWTFSTWVKRAELGQNARLIDVYSNGANFTTFGFDASDRIVLYAINAAVDYGGTYSPRFRDTSAWYHMVWKSDTTNATAANRFQLYVNGVEVTVKDIDYGTPPQNFNSLMNTNISTKIGYNADGSNGSSQYMAETHLIDGQALEPTEFGEFDEDSGIWKPKAYTGSYGTNGFYLDFENSGSLGADSSGNGNNFTLNNITSADQATDTPTNNFCTMNPLLQNPAAITPMTEGATFITGVSSSTNWESRFGTFAVTAGKWYTELKADGAKYTNNIFVGFCGTEYTLAQSVNHLVYGGEAANPGAVAIYSFNGDLSYGGTGTHGFKIYDQDIIALMLDADNGAMYFKKLAGPNSNVSEGTITWSRDGTNTADPTSGASKTGAQIVDWDGATVVAVSLGNNVGGIEMNFGGYNIISNTQSYTDENGYGSFVMQPPTGYYALCTKNLAEYG